MKKITILMVLVLIICSFVGCGGEGKLKTSGVDALNVKELKADSDYTCGSGDTLYSYYEKTEKEFLGACKYYEQEGYKLYSYHELNENKAATYIMGPKMAHIYWIACEGELNVVLSESNGANLPKNLEKIGGKEKITVTQLVSTEINGMGYVIRLTDGSFIIVDGGWDHVVDELWDTLIKLNGGEKDILIRCWIMTHSHNDHYSCFIAFSNKYADRVKLEGFMMSPMPIQLQEGKDTYLNEVYKNDLEKFGNVPVYYVYTGMLFEFGELKLEILYTYDELYNYYTSENYNDASIVSRFYTDDKKMLLLSDAGDTVAHLLTMYYGDYLKSDICQVSNHGVEDCPLSLYRYIKAPVLFFPCSTQLYMSNRAKSVRDGLKNSKYTKEIYVHSLDRYSVEL